jgi:predicted phosphodiesterase
LYAPGGGNFVPLKSYKMKIQYCSDLHLEMAENLKFLTRNPLTPAGEILVLAGDIMTIDASPKFNDFINFASDHYSAVYWVPGNHEYYGFDIAKKPNPICEKIRDNFFLVNNHTVVQGKTKFIFSTLWSRISPDREWDIQRSISDFHAITENGQRLTPHYFSLLHKESLAFLETALKIKGGEQTIVVTHHVPTLLNYPAVYKKSPLTDAFAVELFDFIADSGADYWVYGHHHVNTPAFTIGKTKLMTNQLGYVRQHEHQSFRRAALLE